MDLLGSILGSMQKPPTTATTKQEELAKKQLEKQKELEKQEKAKLQKFRKNVEERINKFGSDDTLKKIEFPSMEKMLRSIVHEVVEVAGLVCHSFGIEDVDRHCVVYKKEYVPCEEELTALKRGEEYDPEKAKLLKQMEEEDTKRSKDLASSVPTTNYKDKYSHLIGKDAGKSAAQITVVNQQFGFVPSANKRDQRSIEQIMNDNRKKKQKVLDEFAEANESS